ncbi:hypothetical protein LZY01_17400 [Levilactobacillus zymae]|uniref:Mobile element protein n=1 Tax=Levilactobacillus zymae TaxID=267363 RepID=A0ABQ0WYR6_9LACO|nr:hypothetical protein LZY01_17400 [Levilactobacillus zymae]
MAFNKSSKRKYSGYKNDIETDYSPCKERLMNMAQTTLEQSLLELDQLLDGHNPGAIIHERCLPASPAEK